jgi:hypothetical protein
MGVHSANIYGQSNNLELSYSEEDVIEFEFNISKDTEKVPMVMGYEDGVPSRPMVYDSTYSFKQNDTKEITLGSPDCDLYIYRFKVYNTSLTASEILSNFIADARTGEELVARYERNQITMTPEELSKQFPDLRVITISAPHFTDGKKFPVNNTTIEYRHEGAGPDEIKYWKCTDAVHVGQGTSSDLYGAAGRNIDLVMKTHKDFNNNPVITLSDGTIVKNVPLSATSVPNNYFNIKVNIASSENANNALL